MELSMKRRNRIVALAALLVMPAAPSFAQQGPHVHGVGRLEIAVEGSTLNVHLDSPLANFVGFEHAPKTAEERAAVHRMEEQARDFARLFRIPAAAGCRVADVVVEIEGGEASAVARGNGHDEKPKAEKGLDKDSHRHEDKEHAKEHAKEHGGAEEVHADLLVEYKLTCANMAALDHLEVSLFDVFPTTEQLRAAIVTPKGQSAATVTRQARRVGLK
jgi:hypothetical protein